MERKAPAPSPIQWVPPKPDDATDWEGPINQEFNELTGQHVASDWGVRLRKTDAACFVEGACKAPSGDFPNATALDVRSHVTRALHKEDRAAIGVDGLEGPPLSPERESAIRAVVKSLAAERLPIGKESALLHFQVVSDLLGEIDRLRGKLQLAGLARDLAGRTAANLRDACDDVMPRSAGRRRKPSGQSE